MFHYGGPQLEAIRFDDFKILMTGKLKGGVPQKELYNIMRDPPEE